MVTIPMFDDNIFDDGMFDTEEGNFPEQSTIIVRSTTDTTYINRAGSGNTVLLRTTTDRTVIKMEANPLV